MTVEAHRIRRSMPRGLGSCVTALGVSLATLSPWNPALFVPSSPRRCGDGLPQSDQQIWGAALGLVL